MPELPEVEVVRRGLVTHLTGATLRDVTSCIRGLAVAILADPPH